MNFTEHIKVREEKFGAVIFETLKEKVYVTNEAGKDILTLLKKENRLEEIVDSLTDSYSEDRSVVERDVKDFIDRLHKNKLVNDASSY